MKKKIILLLILVISLFIYSSRVNAVVMWRECGSIQDEGSCYDYDSDLSLSFVRLAIDESGNNYVSALFKNDDYCRFPNYAITWKEGGSDFFESSFCPVKIEKASIDGDGNFFDRLNNFMVTAFAGKKEVNYDSSTFKMTFMDGYQLVIYKLKNTDRYVMEVYDKDGTYGIIVGSESISANAGTLSDILNNHSDYVSSIGEKIYIIQLAKFIMGGSNYFNITDPNHKVLYGDVVNLVESIYEEAYASFGDNLENKNLLTKKFYRKSYADPESIVDYNSEILYSTPTDPTIWPVVGEWADKVKGNVNSDVVEQYNSIFANGGKYNDTYKEVMKISESIDKNNSYSFPDDFDFESFINKMIETKGTSNKEGPLDIILNYDFSFPAYDEDCNSDDVHTNNGVTSLGGYVSCQYFGTSQAGLDDRTIGFNSSRVVFNVFQQAILTQLENYKRKNPDLSILGYFEESENYLIALATVASYIQTNYAQYDDLLNDFVTECKDELRQRGIEIVIDCNSLLGDELISKIGKYVNIIKIAVPIILILFGIFDFAKAMLAGDDDKMKKAQKSFMIRIAIAVLFFLTPYIVKLLLSIANKVWGFIKPNNCNIWTSK